jgi:UDP-N-acetylmuramate dehydrogenase
MGNGGSFFKNPTIDNEHLESIRKINKEIPSFPVSASTSKVPAAWLIEQCGWKGKRIGDAGVYDKQALVLVNFGSATGKEIIDLAWNIRNSVIERFGIELETEVNII